MSNSTQPKPATITISTYGNGIAVGLDGEKDSINQAFNRFFNWGAAANGATAARTSDDSEMSNGDMGDSYLHFIGEKFAYFLTTETAMLSAMTAQNLAKWQDTPVSQNYKAAPNHRREKKSNGKSFRADAAAAAADEFASFPRENFMLFSKNPMSVYNELDGGAESWASETED